MNKFNVGDIIKSTRGTETIHAIVSDIIDFALRYKVVYLNGGVNGVLGFDYAHNHYVVVSDAS